jgi:hypothetical protein
LEVVKAKNNKRLESGGVGKVSLVNASAQRETCDQAAKSALGHKKPLAEEQKCRPVNALPTNQSPVLKTVTIFLLKLFG